MQFWRAKKGGKLQHFLGYTEASNPLRQKSSFIVEEGKNKIKTCYTTVSSYVFKRGFPTFWVVEMHFPFENKSCFTLIFSALLLTQLVLGLLEKQAGNFVSDYEREKRTIVIVSIVSGYNFLQPSKATFKN